MSDFRTILLGLLVFTISSCTTVDRILVLEGTVVDLDNKGLERAEVSIGGTDTILTGKDGYFCYEGLQPNSNIVIEIRKDGYEQIWSVIEGGAYRTAAKLSLVQIGGSEIGFETLPAEVGEDWYCMLKR